MYVLPTLRAIPDVTNDLRRGSKTPPPPNIIHSYIPTTLASFRSTAHRVSSIEHHPKAAKHAVDDHEDRKARLQLELEFWLDYCYSSKESSHANTLNKTALTATWTHDTSTSTSTNSCRGVLAIVHMHHVGRCLVIRFHEGIVVIVFTKTKSVQKETTLRSSPSSSDDFVFVCD
jgi:hypothetical protein